MADREVDLLDAARGLVTAPAGCGKTHLIARTLAKHAGAKPILVLTHTNAGVAALRARLDAEGVRSRFYRLSTIDGWAMRLISTFPQRSGHDPAVLALDDPASDYPSIRAAAARLIGAGHINDVIGASYSRLIVDEYQDSSKGQHAIVVRTSEILPTCIVGDPMQAIFGFGRDGLADWNEVRAHFPVVGELTTPWRWINADSKDLGGWLLAVRKRLINGEAIDLRNAPRAVIWIELDGSEDRERQLKAARIRMPDDGKVLIIGDSTKPASQRQFASQIPGAITVEAVDLKDLVTFAGGFNLGDQNALEYLAEFGQSVMTNVAAADIVRRVRSLQRGTARNPPNDVEASGLQFLKEPSHRLAVDFLVEMGRQGGARAHRPDVLRACIKALQSCDGTDGSTFRDTAIQMREQNRLVGRPLPRRGVGSTLLLKGLEAEAAVILDAAPMNARHLYVAMTRGSKSLTICSRSPILTPA